MNIRYLKSYHYLKWFSLSTLLATGMLLTPVGWAAHGTPTIPTYDVAYVDGNPSEWNPSDLFGHMYEAGDPDKDHISDLYLRYDCESNVMYARVADLPDDTFLLSATPGEAWIRINVGSPVVDGNSGDNGTAPDFRWVNLSADKTTADGYEASFPLQPGNYAIEAHINFGVSGSGDRTSSTGKFAQGEAIALNIECEGLPPEEPSIVIEKHTNGQDADAAPGPNITEGNDVSWQYFVTNTGNVKLVSIGVTDDKIGVVTCPKTILEPDEDMVCTAQGTAEKGQYKNVGSVIGTSVAGVPVVDTDPSHYYGVEAFKPAPAIDIEKSTNGFDADVAPGPEILEGKDIVWSYHVTNTGNVNLINIVVTDDKNGVVNCPATTLEPSVSMVCTAQGTAVAGQYENLGSVVGVYQPVTGSPTNVQDSDPSHYFGADPSLAIEKSTQNMDADEETGPFVQVGDTVYWAYLVTNDGNVPLSNIVVTDDKLENDASDIQCQNGTNVIASLAVDESFSCLATGTAIEGQYGNIGSADSSYTDDLNHSKTVHVEDPSHYFGALLAINIEKSTNGVDADEPPGVFVLKGGLVNWEYVVTNAGNVALSNIQISDDMGVVLSYISGDLNEDYKLDLNETWIYKASDVAILGQYANKGIVSGELDVEVCVDEDGVLTCKTETKTANDMDPSHYYGFIANQPSIEILDLTFDRHLGDCMDMSNGCDFIQGSFTIENASDGPEVTAIGIENITFTVEYRDANNKKWTNALIGSSSCSTDPTAPFVFEGSDGATVDVDFNCSVKVDGIPAKYTAVRVTTCIEIFNRDETGRGKNSGQGPHLFCSSNE